MIFGIITVIVVLGLFLGLPAVHYRHLCAKPDSKKKPLRTYPAWLIQTAAGLTKASSLRKLRADYISWMNSHYPGWQKWIWIGLTSSFAVQALSGFIFSGFGFLSMRGIPLIFHVSFGGLFAVFTAAALFIRSGFYTLHDAEISAQQGRKYLFLSILFWLFISSVFVLASSALLMMLPFVSLSLSRSAFLIHAYSALICVTVFCLLIYFTLINKNIS